jgi:carnitine 3-dehydrogenase
VRPEWVDYNGHMSDFLYGHVFGEAMDVLYRQVGIDDDFRKAGRMFYTVESHVRHLAEAKVGEPLYSTIQVLALDDKRLHVFHRLHRKRDDVLIATGEQMHLFVDTVKTKAAVMDSALRAKLESVRQAHASQPVPDEAGKPVGSRAR